MNKIVLTSLLFVIAVSLLIIAYFLSPLSKNATFLNSKTTPIVTKSETKLENPSNFPPVRGFIIKGDKIYDGNTELFYNVPGYVKAIRLGPDTHSVHFQLSSPTDPWSSPAKCADLTAPFDPAKQADYPSASYPMPPQHAPWDYKQIGNAYTIHSCNDRGGGFLENSNQFVYFQINQYHEGSLHIENLETKKSFAIPISKEITSGFLESKNGSPITRNGTEFPSYQNGTAYLYPRHDAPLIKNKTLLVFGGLVMGISEENTGSLMGYAPDTKQDSDSLYDISFGLMTDKNTPVAIRTFGWEGISNYQMLYDYSTNHFQTIDLSKIEQPGFDVLGLRKIDWLGNNGVLIHFYKENDEKYDDIPHEIKNIDNQDEIKSVEQSVENTLKQKLSNPNVKCILGPGEFGGCFSATNFQTYKYVPGSGQLEKQ